MTLLQLQDVSRTFGSGPSEVVALDSVELSLGQGELIALMGPSGSGKSTLLNVAGGLDSPTSGAVVVLGRPLATLTRRELATLRRRSIGYVFQRGNLLPSLTAAENVMAPRELDGVGARKARAEALVALAQVGMDGHADRFPDDLSGGQQQRIAIARAVVGGREIILADEPTAALDSAAAEDVMRLVRACCDAGAGAIVATHDARHAAWADRVIFLHDGAIADESIAAAPMVRP